MKKLALLFLLFTCFAANAQTGAPVKQSGTITPGHATKWTSNGVISDAGTAANGSLTSIGVTASGPGICQNSGPTTGPYNRLCLGVNTSSAATLSLQNLGGASPQTFSFNLNGTTYPFPFALPGTGVIGPTTPPTVVGDIAVWANTSGTLLGSVAGTTFGNAGNNLINFSNPGLLTNNHKKIMYVGESTVWAATEWFSEFCTMINSSTVYTALGLTPCTRTISGYQVLDNAGSIQVTFSGATPSGYTVGDLVLSEPSEPALNTLIGTGVVTEIGANTITYTLLNLNGLPSSGSFTASSGFITNSLANLGVNGGSSTAINAIVTPILQTYAKPGDLVLVRGPLINDVRLGACNLACAVANIKTLYQAIVTAIPSTTDIAWKTENSFLTTDPTSSGYVSPLADSAAYSAIIRNSVYQAFAEMSVRAPLWDTMQIAYTKLGYELPTSIWMTDIIHPNFFGMIHEVNTDLEILTNIISTRGLQTLQMNNPYSYTTSNGAVLSGDKTYIKNLQTMVGFSPFTAEQAQANNYASPWTLYPDAVLDPEKYDIVAYGENIVCSSSCIRFTSPTVPGSSPTQIRPGDLIWFMGEGVIRVPVGFSQASFNSGGTVYVRQLASLGSIVPAAVYDDEPIVVLRQHSYTLADVPYYLDNDSYPYRHRIIVTAGGANTITIQFNDGTPSWPTGLTTAATLVLPCGTTSLSGATFSNSSGNTQISITGSFGGCVGDFGWVFGPQPLENNISIINANGATSGTQVWSPAATTSGQITWPAGTVDFSATGGTSQVVKQTSSGGIFTVAKLAASDLSDTVAYTTWTCGFAFGGGTTGIAYANNTCYYYKIGKLVFITGYIQLSAKGSSTGAVTITGLPVPLENPHGYISATVGNFSNLAGGTGATGLAIWGAYSTAPSSLTLVKNANVSTTAVTDTDFTDTTLVQFSGTYITD